MLFWIRPWLNSLPKINRTNKKNRIYYYLYINSLGPFSVHSRKILDLDSLYGKENDKWNILSQKPWTKELTTFEAPILCSSFFLCLNTCGRNLLVGVYKLLWASTIISVWVIWLIDMILESRWNEIISFNLNHTSIRADYFAFC